MLIGHANKPFVNKKEGHYIIIKQSTLQEDITIHDICASTNSIIIYEEKTDTTVRRSR